MANRNIRPIYSKLPTQQKSEVFQLSINMTHQIKEMIAIKK